MTKLKIFADSTCDLNRSLIEKYDITILPLSIVLDDKSYFDMEEITPKEIYAWADQNHKTPKTAAVSVDRAIEGMRPYAEQGYDILFLGISEDMSTTCNVVRLAKEELNYDRIFIINSMNLSTGIGLQVIRAARLAEEGKTAEEIVAEIESVRDKVRASFVVDVMDYLAMGGRCSSVTALLATTLKLKPMIEVKNGKMGVGKKYHGHIEKVILKYASDLKEQLLHADKHVVFVTHSSCEEQEVESVMKFLNDLNYFDEVIETNAGGVISSHCGPGTLGVLFYEQ